MFTFWLCVNTILAANRHLSKIVIMFENVNWPKLLQITVYDVCYRSLYGFHMHVRMCVCVCWPWHIVDYLPLNFINATNNTWGFVCWVDALYIRKAKNKQAVSMENPLSKQTYNFASVERVFSFNIPSLFAFVFPNNWTNYRSFSTSPHHLTCKCIDVHQWIFFLFKLLSICLIEKITMKFRLKHVADGFYYCMRAFIVVHICGRILWWLLLF